MFKSFINYISSVKLTQLFLLYFILFLIFVSFIPRTGLDTIAIHPAWVQSVLQFLVLNQFTHSPLFLFPVLLFTLHILLCVIKRILKQKKGTISISGADIIHIGLIILIIGGGITFFFKHENTLLFTGEEEYPLFNNDTIRLVSTKSLSGKEGHIKDWISQFTITSSRGKTHDIQVSINKPATYLGIHFYLMDWQIKDRVFLEDNRGTIHFLEPGEGIVDGNNQYQFIKVIIQPETETEEAVFLWSGREESPVIHHLRVNEKISLFTIKKAEKLKQVQIKQAKDPGFFMVVLSFIIFITGIIILMAKKILVTVKER